MSGVDDRIVSMTFDNESFERKLAATLTSLDKLSESLRFAGAQRGFADIASAADNVDLSGMASAVENISNKFSALGAIAFTVLQNITTSAIDFVKKLGGDILEPLISGGKRRATNIENAKFQFRGLGIDVEEGMKSALDAVKGTAFGLDEAAKAAAQFGASGIAAGADMTSALRAIAGSAAMTNTSFSEMADIFTSSAGSGIVNNQDLGQFATRGLNAAAAIAKVMNITEAEVHQMASAGKLDFKTFSDAMDAAFGEHATKANETYTGALANMRAALSRVGASFFGPKMEQQRDLFNALTPVIDNVNTALQPLIKSVLAVSRLSINSLVEMFKKVDVTNLQTGMEHIGRAVIHLFEAFHQLGTLIRDAFRDIFPKDQFSVFIAIATAVENFSKQLKMGGETANKVKSIFRGFFAVFEIGWTILKEIADIVWDVIKVLLPAGSGILNFGASTGEALVKLNEALVAGGGIHRFFERLREVISNVIGFIVDFKNKVADIWSGFTDSSAVENSIDRVETRFDQLTSIPDKISEAWSRVQDRFQGFFDVLDRVGDYIKNWFGELGNKIAEAFQPGDFDAAVDILNVGLLGGIAIMLKKFLSGGMTLDFGTGLIDKIREIFDGVTGTLQAMQTNLKAEALIKIAGALALLTASIVVLSLIDSAALTKALTAITIGFGQLVGVMVLLEKSVASPAAAAKISIAAATLIEIAVAMDLLSLAIRNLSGLDWDDLAKGLVGIGAGLAALALSTQLIAADTAGLVRAGVSMIAISTALIILSKAVESFSTMSWGDMAKGLTGVAGGLLLITVAMKYMPPSSVLSGFGLIEFAVGLRILFEAVKAFSTIGWAEMGKGLVGIGGALIVIAGAMQLMPISLPITATGILIMSAALYVMAKAVKEMGEGDLGTLAKGIGALAIMLGVLSAAMVVMSGTIGGAASLVIVSGALLILTHVLEKLGRLSLQELATGLGAIAATLAILGGAALILTPLIPEMAALGIALGLIGGAFALFGAGAFLTAKAFEAMAVAGRAGAEGIVESIKILLTALPDITKALAASIIDLGKELLEATPLLIRLMGAILDQLLETVIKETPKIGKALAEIIDEWLKLVRAKFPDIVRTGFEMLISLMTGLRDNIKEIATLAVEIVTRFLDAVAEQVPTIIDSVYNLVTAIIKGVVLKFVDLGKEFFPKGAELMGGLLLGIIEKVPDLISWFGELPGKILSWIGDLANTLKDNGIKLIIGFFIGVMEKEIEVAHWLGALPGRIISWISDLGNTLLTKGFQLIQGLLNGIINGATAVAAWFFSLPGQFFSWLPNPLEILSGIGVKIMQGLINGIKSMKDKLIDTLKEVGSWIPVHKGPPAKDAVMLFNNGRLIMQGLLDGMMQRWTKVLDWLHSLDPAEHLDNQLTNNMRRVIGSISDQLSNLEEFNPVITPVLDLSKVEAASTNLERFMRLSPITPEVSLNQARHISTTAELNKTSDDISAQQAPTEITFNQNNYSPEALSVNDIWRQTKSQLALAKEELGIS